MPASEGGGLSAAKSQYFIGLDWELILTDFFRYDKKRPLTNLDMNGRLASVHLEIEK